jgi:hypothetical protein
MVSTWITRCLDLVHLADANNAIEDRLPVLVAGEIIVGDEEAPDARGPVTFDQMLDIVRRAPPRLAALHVDDGAE